MALTAMPTSENSLRGFDRVPLKSFIVYAILKNAISGYLNKQKTKKWHFKVLLSEFWS